MLAALTHRVSLNKKDVDGWLELLRLEYAESRGDPAALRRLASKFSAAFSSIGAGDVRRSAAFSQLQIDEARVVMCVRASFHRPLQ